MRDTERIIMIMRYVYVCDSFLKDEYINKLDNYKKVITLILKKF